MLQVKVMTARKKSSHHWDDDESRAWVTMLFIQEMMNKTSFVNLW